MFYKIRMIQLLLLSLSLVTLKAQHMDHQHQHADTKPETDLRPNEFFHRYDDYGYYDYAGFEQSSTPATETTTTTETTTYGTKYRSWSYTNDVTTGAPWSDGTEATPVACTGYEWRCLDDHFCLPESSRCNGIIECLDFSDEKHCDSEESYMARSTGSFDSLPSPFWIIAAILLPYL